MNETWKLQKVKRLMDLKLKHSLQLLHLHICIVCVKKSVIAIDEWKSSNCNNLKVKKTQLQF